MTTSNETSLTYRLFFLGGNTPDQIEEAEAVIRTVSLQHRYIFQYLFGSSTARIDNIEASIKNGVRCVYISYRSGPSRSIYGSITLTGQSAEIFDDRERLTELGDRVRIAWTRIGSPVRKEWLRQYPRGSNWQ